MMQPEFQELTLKTADGLDVYYRHHTGSGQFPAVIFLHGLTGNRTAWEEFEQYFASRGYSTFALDLRGHGRSTKKLSNAQFAIPAFAEDVRLLCEKHEMKDSIVVGHCFGGLVALQAVHSYPELFAKVVLISPFYKTNRAKTGLVRTILNAAASLNEHLPFTLPRLRRRFGYAQYWKLKKLPYPVFPWNDLLGNPLTLYQQGIKHAYAVDALAIAARIAKPVLIWSGTRDTFVPHSYSRLMSETIPHARFEEFKGGDHIVNIRYPEIMTESILHFIEENA